jgi:hypothetical protein
MKFPVKIRLVLAKAGQFLNPSRLCSGIFAH